MEEKWMITLQSPDHAQLEKIYRICETTLQTWIIAWSLGEGKERDEPYNIPIFQLCAFAKLWQLGDETKLSRGISKLKRQMQKFGRLKWLQFVGQCSKAERLCTEWVLYIWIGVLLNIWLNVSQGQAKNSYQRGLKWTFLKFMWNKNITQI